MSPRTPELRPTRWLRSERAMERELESCLRPDADTLRVWQPSLRDWSEWRIHAIHQYAAPLLNPGCSLSLVSRFG